jgi:hypothetical protein
MQGILSALRSDGADAAPIPTAIPDLVENFRTSGLEVLLETDADLDDLEPAAYRVLQEAMTNAQRRGVGPIRVGVVKEADGLRLTVTNRVRPTRSERGTPGFGLIGMRERVSAAGCNHQPSLHRCAVRRRHREPDRRAGHLRHPLAVPHVGVQSLRVGGELLHHLVAQRIPVRVTRQRQAGQGREPGRGEQGQAVVVVRPRPVRPCGGVQHDRGQTLCAGDVGGGEAGLLDVDACGPSAIGSRHASFAPSGETGALTCALRNRQGIADLHPSSSMQCRMFRFTPRPAHPCADGWPDARGGAMPRRTGRPVHLPLLAAAMLAGSMLAVPAASASPGEAAPDCVMRIETRAITCFADFRAAISAATGGRVTDAPVTAAPLDRATTARVNAAGTAAAKAIGSRNLAANTNTVLAVEYLDPGYTGGSLSIVTDQGPCRDGMDYFVNSLPSGWNDLISSFQSFNNCFTTHYEHNDRQGQSMEWYANDQIGYVWLNDQISSIKLNRGPSRQELLDLCNNGTDSCDFHPTTGVSESYRDFHEVARIYNCSPTAQNRQLAWSDTTGGSITLTTEVSVTAGFNVKALAKFEATVKQSFSRNWSWSSTFSDTSSIAVAPWSWGALDRSPKLQSVGGYYELHFGSRRWGHYIWYVQNFVGTGPVPQDAGVTRIRGNALTSAEISANCGRGAAKADNPARRVSTTHSIVPINPVKAAIETPLPVHAG